MIDNFAGIIRMEYKICIIYFLRFDVKSDTKNYDWLLISWCPDVAPIRQKMLYASTKATLKQEFGSAKIKEELHGTIMVKIILYISHINIPDFLTELQGNLYYNFQFVFLN